MGVNTGQVSASACADPTFRQSHAAFHFLFDYVPNWELAYGRGGLIQYQSFLPKETALEVAWTEMLALSIETRPALLPGRDQSATGRTNSCLPTPWMASPLALDFKVTTVIAPGLRQMLQDFDRIVLDAGGRFYFAKNSETTAETARRFLGEATIQKFRALKKRCDPNHLLESDLYRRVFAE